jgi:hypothetical protein
MSGSSGVIVLDVVGLIVAGVIIGYIRKRQASNYEARSTTTVLEVGFRWRDPTSHTRWKSGVTALGAGRGHLRIGHSTLALDLDLDNPRAPTWSEEILIEGKLRIVTAVDTANQSTAEVALFPSDIYSLAQEKL